MARIISKIVFYSLKEKIVPSNISPKAISLNEFLAIFLDS
jgi:hypothetical protein